MYASMRTGSGNMECVHDSVNRAYNRAVFSYKIQIIDTAGIFIERA